MFTDKIEPIVSNGVPTMGGKDIIPKGIVRVSWSWNYDDKIIQTKKLNNMLYFSDSPVNILSATA